MTLPAPNELAGIPYAGFLVYRLKVQPEDFLVDELSDLEISKIPPTGSAKSKKVYRVYELSKTGWNTVDALSRIARQRKIAYESFSYGGKKDRHATTTQLVTLPGQMPEIRFEEEKISLVAKGFSDEPMAARQLRGNRFTITLRSLQKAEVPALEKNISQVRRYGFINYFDEQRFGGYDRDLGIAGIPLIQGNLSHALLILVTGIHPSEKRHARERKLQLRNVWGDWKKSLALAKTNTEKRVFQELSCSGDFRRAMDLLPGEELSLALSALQSYVWNTVIALLVSSRNGHQQNDHWNGHWNASGAVRLKFRAMEPVIGLLALSEEASAGQGHFPSSGAAIPVPGPETVYEDQGAQDALRRALQLIDQTELRDPGLRRAHLQEHAREPIVIPEDLKIQEVSADELYPGRKKMKLQYALPPGAYATMLVKHITMRRREVARDDP